MGGEAGAGEGGPGSGSGSGKTPKLVENKQELCGLFSAEST